MKRLPVLLLCFFMCCFSAFISSADEMIQYGDGCISAVDALRILQYAVGKFDLDEEAK